MLSYDVAVRSLDGAGPQKRGVALTGGGGSCSFKLTNTGAAAPGDTPDLNADIYRLTVSVEGAGWTARLRNGLAALRFGDSTVIPVYLSKTGSGTAPATVTLRATSESEPSQSATATCAAK